MCEATMKPVRQRTIHVTIKDRAAGWVCFMSIRVERHRITLHPTPGVALPVQGVIDVWPVPPFDRLDARALRLGTILQRRWFTDGE